MTQASLTNSATDTKVRNQDLKTWAPEKVVLPLVNFLATMQIVEFYINRVPSYLDLNQYEAGMERMPYQGRLLMEYPLRWAHTSRALASLAAWFNGTRMWVPRNVLPEDFVEVAIYLISILIAGLVARDLYRTHSRTRLLTPYVYPLVLVMIAGSCCLGGHNYFRYFYDLPSLGFFAAGLYLISHKHHPALFAALFVIATFNRETSLFLLFFFVASSCIIEEKQIVWPRAQRWKFGGTATLLLIFWLAWRIWTKRHFAGFPTESGIGFLGNFSCLLFPFLWPQVAGIAAYTLPILLIFRRDIHSAELRLWLWVVPIWFAVMMYFGIIFEIRLFGELIPVFACAAVLLAEERIYLRLERSGLENPATAP